MRFKSAVDTWFYILGIVVPALIFVFVLLTLGFDSSEVFLSLGVIALLTLGLPVWLLFSTNYEVSDKVLTVQSGPFNWSVPLNEISSIQPSRSLLSSPALSLNRLEIQYGNGQTLLVSPSDMEGFKDAVLQYE